MTLRGDSERLLSQPVRLHWMGWESDTYTLQNNGWEISSSEDMQYRRMAIAIRHQQANIRGMSDYLDWDFFQHMDAQQRRGFQDPRSLPMFGCQLASEFRIEHRNMGTDENLYDFNPIDARPMMIDSNISSLDDLAHFRKIEKPGDEIFLRKASMAEILEMALSKQEPDQQRIRKQMIRDQELSIMRNSQLRANLRLVA